MGKVIRVGNEDLETSLTIPEHPTLWAEETIDAVVRAGRTETLMCLGTDQRFVTGEIIATRFSEGNERIVFIVTVTGTTAAADRNRGEEDENTGELKLRTQHEIERTNRNDK